MRKSYLAYLGKRMREGDLFIVPRLARQQVGTMAGRALGRSLAGPINGGIVCTYRCNLRCSMCELWKRPERYEQQGRRMLSTDEMKGVIEDFAAIGTTGLAFTGGEPLTRPDMLELVAHAARHRLISHMSCNGMAITERKAEEVAAAGLDAIGFSLDGATAATHDGIRGVPGSFDKVLNAIRAFRRLNRTSKRKIVIVVVTVISGLNIDEIPALVRLLDGEGVDKISFIPFHDIGLLANGEPQMAEHRIPAAELAKLDAVVDELIAAKRRYGIIDSSAAYLGLFKRCFRDQPLPIDCYAGYATLYVDPYGDYYPCFPRMEIGAAGAGLANVREIPLRRYWGSPELRTTRKAIRGCRKCYWNNQTELSLLYRLGPLPRALRAAG